MKIYNVKVVSPGETRLVQVQNSFEFPSGGLLVIFRDVFTKEVPSKSWYCKKGCGLDPCQDFVDGFGLVYRGHSGKVTHIDIHNLGCYSDSAQIS